MISSIEQLLKLMKSHGATRFYAKKLAPNDNSKNQVYLGGDFSVLNKIPHDEIQINTESIAGSKRDRSNASLSFYWVDTDGKYEAPNAQLILYPKYPEVRMSGFLKGCKKAPSYIMKVRDEGRVLFLGISKKGDILAYASGKDELLSKELHSKEQWEDSGVFVEIPPDGDNQPSTKQQLLEKLRFIYEKDWITSQKMRSDGLVFPYVASNAGGYTLEAELGIAPNSYAEPDYLGWEIKQYSVTDFIKFRPKSAVTLMTPEPSGGIYKDLGVPSFLNQFGYPDQKGIANRINFGGIYSYGKDFHHLTNLKLIIDGYDPVTNKITKIDGSIRLISKHNEVAAQWDFNEIMNHWNRKHCQAAYIPSLFHKPPPMYKFGPKVFLCDGTDFFLFLKAISMGKVYYDPAVKMTNTNTSKPLIKKRSQFRIKHKDLAAMYQNFELIELS